MPRYKLQRIADVQTGDGAVAMNNRGQVLLGTESSKILLWQDGKVRALPAVATAGSTSRRRGRARRARGGGRSVAIWDAHDINDRGQIVGLAADGQACVYHNGRLRLLGALSNSGKWDGGAASPRQKAGFCSLNTASSINEAGDVIGTSFTPAPTERVFSGAKEEGATQSWLLRRGSTASATILQSKYGCYARDINESGHVAGSFGRDTTAEGFSVDRAFVWDGQMRDLGEGRAAAINDRGQIVGGSGDAENDSSARALLWQDGQKRDLGPGEAADINNAGQIVGKAKTSDKWKSVAAILWQDGQPILLKDRLDKDYNVRLESARLINDRGQIVVRAYPGGGALAFYALLTPIS